MMAFRKLIGSFALFFVAMHVFGSVVFGGVAVLLGAPFWGGAWIGFKVVAYCFMAMGLITLFECGLNVMGDDVDNF